MKIVDQLTAQECGNLTKLHTIREMMMTSPEIFDQISICKDLIWISTEIHEIELVLSSYNEKAALHGDLDVVILENTLVSSIPADNWNIKGV